MKESMQTCSEFMVEQKSKEAEDDYEMSLKQGKGGSLMKNLKSSTKSRGYKCLKSLAKDDTTRLTTTKSKLKRWCEHFKEVTNINTLVNHSAFSHLPQSLPPSDSSLYPMTEPLTNEELCVALKQCKKKIARLELMELVQSYCY